MAAYAALMSLTNIIEDIQNHRRLSASLDKNQAEALVKVLNSLQDFLDKGSREATQALESQIVTAAYAAEDTIESHIVDQINSDSFFNIQVGESSFSNIQVEDAAAAYAATEEKSPNSPTHARRFIRIKRKKKINSKSSSSLDLKSVTEELDSIHRQALTVQEEMGVKKWACQAEALVKMPKSLHIVDQIDSESVSLPDSERDSILHQALKVQEEMGDKKLLPTFPTPAAAASSTPAAAASRHLEKMTTNMVGFDDQLVKLLDKTTLAQKKKINSESISLLDLTNVIEEMDSLHQKAMKVLEEMGDKKLRPAYSTAPDAATSRPLEKMTTNMVGFDDELVKLLDKLEGGEPNRQIVLIDGMGGIGKTTLAQSAFEKKLIMQHFDTRSWVTVSQTYSVLGILCDLLSIYKAQEHNGQDQKEEEARLGEQLHKKLFSRRYLVILDDMWSIDAWDRIRPYLPDNNNGSRVIITTRESHMSIHLGSSRLPMRLLNEDQSWELLCEKVFSQKGSPPEFEKIGMKIVKSCKGLPLSISVIGGLLRKSSMTLENWEKIAKDINSILINSREDEQCSNILSLSYDYLHAHLKPCFLYMGIFSEDDKIYVSKVTELWVAEGFIKPNKSQSLEAIARGYCQDLIDRNLIIPIDQAYYGKSKRIKMHDLVRELCLATAKKYNFLHETEVVDVDSVHHRRIVIHPTIWWDAYEQHGGKLAIPLVRSLILGRNNPFSFKCKLLRVLSAKYENKDSPEFIFVDHVNLRYLALDDESYILKLPRSIFRLWNLQTLIVRGYECGTVAAPVEIWRMSQLRHIEFNRISLPIPPPGNQRDGDRVVLRNLHTLRDVWDFTMSEDVRRRIPNVKKLYLTVDNIEFQKEINFEGLDELETLRLEFRGEVPEWGGPDTPRLQQLYKWPASLKKLSLIGCNIGWEDLSTIGSLPLLEDLWLRGGVRGAEWSPIDGEFLSLKFLRIEGIWELIHWNAESSHFPKLETLYLSYAIQLEEIPLDIGNIPTLRYIGLERCSASSAISAMRILQEQEEDYGNYDLTVRVYLSSDEEKRKMFREAVEEKVSDSLLHMLQHCLLHWSAAEKSNSGFSSDRLFYS